MSGGGASRPGLVIPIVGLLCLPLLACGDLISDPEAVDVALPAREELVALIQGVGDVSVRVAPHLTDPVAAAPLRSALADLASALNAVDGPAADRALQSLKAARATYAATPGIGPEDLPELDAIAIALARVDGQLRRLCSRTTSVQSVSSAYAQEANCTTK